MPDQPSRGGISPFPLYTSPCTTFVLSPELQSLAQLCLHLRMLIPGVATGKGAALPQGRAVSLHFYKQEEKNKPKKTLLEKKEKIGLG